MTTLIRAELKAASGIPADSVINNWVVGQLQPGDASPGTASQAINSFYSAIAQYISSSRQRAAGGISYKFYDINDLSGVAPLGSPYFMDSGTLPAGDATQNLPEEVAAVMTLRGTNWDTSPVEAPDGIDAGTAPDRPRQRHSGRVFLGPLKASAVATEAATNHPRINVGAAGFAELALVALEDLVDTLAVQGRTLYVWSRKGTALYPVVRGEMDNAFDTIRKRGPKASARINRTFT